jgi:hypothetical protein
MLERCSDIQATTITLTFCELIHTGLNPSFSKQPWR